MIAWKRVWEIEALPWVDETRRWLTEAGAVFVKDAKTEWRTRVAASATGLFAVGSVLLIALALHQSNLGLSGDTARLVYTVLLWLLLFYTAASGLGRAFVLEEERGTALALRLVARASAVWTGKFLLNLVLLLALACIVTPLLWAAIGLTGPTNLLLLVAVLFLGCVGIASTLTMTGALVAQASAKGGLLAVLSLPILILLFTAAIHGTLAAVGVGSKPDQVPEWTLGTGDLRVLVSFAGISIPSALLLFEYLWND